MAETARQPKGRQVAGVRRGEIWLVSFDPTVGHEIKKTRPALVIQNDVGNRYSPLTIVAAITSSLSPVPYPVEVHIEPAAANGLDVRSAIRLDQIRTVDRRRLLRRLGVADAATMGRVDEAIQISLGLVEF
ncbi:MAG: type II toxin-antitoxin system PemK/MazF family toxin [Bryobacteraceae bacterium]|jgi:mRNA interferase MazF